MRRVFYAVLLTCGIFPSAFANEQRPTVRELVRDGWTVAAMDSGYILLQGPKKIAICVVPLRPLGKDPLAGDDLFSGECRTSE